METTIQEKITCPACEQSSTHLYVKDGFDVARCIACKTLFVENPPPDTSALYSESYFFGSESGGGYGSYDAEKESMRQTFEKCLDLIQTYQQEGELFDVGAATGYFLALARSRGFRVSGIDISAAAAAEAKKKNIDVQVGTLETVSYPSSSFDIVTMFDVIEHVSSPKTILLSAGRMLKPGGVLMGCTPDSMSVNARLMGKQWHLLCPPEHLVLLNEKSVRRLLQKQGFEVIWTGRITKRFSAPYILQTASRWLRLSFLSRLGSLMRGTWLARIAIPLDLRDNVFFIARYTGV